MSQSILERAVKQHGPEGLMAIVSKLTPQEQAAIPFDWAINGRPEQLEPEGAWRNWIILAGRGFGKTRTGAETVRLWVESGRYKRIALVARTAKDIRDTMMNGPSGFMSISPPWNRPTWQESKNTITWPNGAYATTYSAEEPRGLRGPEHDAAWCDEVAAWQYPDTWDQLQMGLRSLGAHQPRVIATTTPLPTAFIRGILKSPKTVITRGRTFDNAKNLAPDYIDYLKAKYSGTRLARQELDAELLEDVVGALWKGDDIDNTRVVTAPDLRRVVIAVDPAVSSNEKSDETGIVVAGVDSLGAGYVIADLSARLTPNEWAQAAVNAYHLYSADRIVAESNQGGALVKSNIQTVMRNAPVTLVHASKGKYTRAEPIAALYEQKRVHHVGYFAELEQQMTNFTGDPAMNEKSPDRMDALVYALTDLMLGAGDAIYIGNFPTKRGTEIDSDDGWDDDDDQ